MVSLQAVNFATDVVEKAPPGERALVEIARDGGRREWTFGEVAAAARTVAARLGGLERGDVVVSVGGDGMLASVAGLVAERGGVLGVVPAGRGNDFARMVGIPSEPAAVADVAVPAHKTWHARTRLPVGSDRVGRWQHRLDPADIHRRTAGNPFFVSQILAQPGSPMPESVRDAVLARIRTLDDPAREALSGAAALRLVRGYDGKLGPADNVERAQVAALLQRFEEWLG